MKKIIITLLVFIGLIGLLAVSPIIGNKIVTYYVDTEIVALKQKGITLNFKSETPGYLYTSKQYEFILTDVEAFAAYMTEYGAGLLPPYSDELLKSIVFRLDMTYNNIPFLEPISIDIYPMYISDSMMNKLKGSNNVFFNEFQKFITRQGLLYHIDYDLLSENYKGEIKNIDYNERGFDGSNVILTLHDAVFNGTGSKSLESDIQKIMLKTSDASKDMTLEINKLSTTSTKTVSDTAKTIYEKSKDIYDKSVDTYNDSQVKDHVEVIKEKTEDAAREMYNTSVKMQSMFFNTRDKDTEEETTIDAKGVDINTSSQESEDKAKKKSYFFFESLNLKTNDYDIKMSKAKYETAMSGVDIASFKKLQSLVVQAQNSSSLDDLNDIKISAINLLSNGMKVEIPDLSVENVEYKGENLGGFKLISALNVKEDKNLAAKMLFSPLFIVQNIDFKVHLEVSKKIYNKFVEEVPLALLAMAGTKQTATDLVYDFSYINGQLKVNGNIVL